MTEDQLQAACTQFAWNTHPKTRGCLWAVPNGGTRDRIEAAKLKATGTLAGVHDLHMLWNGRFYTFELKVGNNTLSSKQEWWGEVVTKQGAVCHEIRTFESFKEIFETIINQPCSNS